MIWFLYEVAMQTTRIAVYVADSTRLPYLDVRGTCNTHVKAEKIVETCWYIFTFFIFVSAAFCRSGLMSHEISRGDFVAPVATFSRAAFWREALCRSGLLTWGLLSRNRNLTSAVSVSCSKQLSYTEYSCRRCWEILSENKYCNIFFQHWCRW